MKAFLPCVLLLAASASSHAFDKACEPFVAAAEKSARQPARHSVSELEGGIRLEAITVDGKSFTNMNGQWNAMKSNLLIAEQNVNADLRSGKIPVTDCKVLGRENVDGIATTVIGYTVAFGGVPATGKAYIGGDGLVYALASDSQRVRYRYTGVTAPKS